MDFDGVIKMSEHRKNDRSKSWKSIQKFIETQSHRNKDFLLFLKEHPR